MPCFKAPISSMIELLLLLTPVVIHGMGTIGAFDTSSKLIICIEKLSRRAFLELIGFASTTTEQKILAFTKRIGTEQVTLFFFTTYLEVEIKFQKHDPRRNSQHSQHSVIHELDVGGMRTRYVCYLLDGWHSIWNTLSRRFKRLHNRILPRCQAVHNRKPTTSSNCFV